MLIFCKDPDGQLLLLEADVLGYDEECRELYADTPVGMYGWMMPDFMAESHMASAFALGKVDLSHAGPARLVED